MKKFIATLLTFVLTVSLPCLSLKANFYEDNTYQVIDEFDYDYDIDCNDDLIEVVELDDKEVALLKQKFSAQCESVEVYSRSWSMYGSNYCYSQMNDVEKEFYNRLDEITMHYMNSAEDAVFLYDNGYIRGVDYGDLSLERERAIEIAKIYMYQNPQYYFISKWIYAPQSQSIIYLGCLSEFVDGSERLSMTNEIFAKIDSWMLEVDEIPSEYGKALKIHDILCENVDYKLNEYDQSIYSVVILGETRCGGYAKFFCTLANVVGLDCIGIIGKGHAWNKVKIEGNWYNIDATWDDGNTITRKYFCRSDEYFEETGHVTEDFYQELLPSCNSDLLEEYGIYEAVNNRENIILGMVASSIFNTDVEYSWYLSTGSKDRKLLSDWNNSEWFGWYPDNFGTYNIECDARIVGNEDSTVNAKASIEYHPHIKGVCQMPYEGGGFLIGVESYDNPGQKYSYELLILDCTLLSKGEPAWIYTTGKNTVEYGNAFWAVWKPQYGYYWTLFRVFDEEGSIIDEKCYGFVNI